MLNCMKSQAVLVQRQKIQCWCVTGLRFLQPGGVYTPFMLLMAVCVLSKFRGQA